ncbi:hypothetical protein K2X05_07855 [bacterium]|nr:hypothetical protein [bacterium]
MLRVLFVITTVLFYINNLYASSFSSEIPISLFLSSSEHTISLAQNSVFLSAQDGSLFLPERVSHIEWINAHQIRLHFATPIHIQLMDKKTQQLISEKIFRQILIKADEDTIEKLYAVANHPNLTLNSNAIEQMTKIIESVESEDVDPLIKEFADGKMPPAISRRLGFVFSLDVDNIGMPGGIESGRTHVLSKVISHLSWTVPARETDVQSTPLQLVQRVFAEHNSLIEDYLSSLQKIEGRKQQLVYRGWIKPLIPHHGKLFSSSQDEKKLLNTSNNVIPLNTKIRCENIFTRGAL